MSTPGGEGGIGAQPDRARDSKHVERHSSPSAERKVITPAVVVALVSVGVMLAFYAFTGARYTTPPKPLSASEQVAQSMKLEMDQLKSDIEAEFVELEKDLTNHFRTFEVLKFELGQLRNSLASKDDFAKLQNFDLYSAQISARVESLSTAALQQARATIVRLFSGAKAEFKNGASRTHSKQLLRGQLLHFETEFQRQLDENAQKLRGDILGELSQFDSHTRHLISEHVHKHLTGDALRNHIYRLALVKTAEASVTLNSDLDELLKVSLSADIDQANAAISKAKADLSIIQGIFGNSRLVKEASFAQAAARVGETVVNRLSSDKSVSSYSSVQDWIVLDGRAFEELVSGDRKLKMIKNNVASELPGTKVLSPAQVTLLGDSPVRAEVSTLISHVPVDRSYFAFSGATGGFTIKFAAPSRVAGVMFRQSPSMLNKRCVVKSIVIEGTVGDQKHQLASLDSVPQDELIRTQHEHNAYDSVSVHVTGNHGDRFTCVSAFHVYTPVA